MNNTEQKCTKPDCDCIEQAELKAGGPVKSYPCLKAKYVEDEMTKLKADYTPTTKAKPTAGPWIVKAPGSVIGHQGKCVVTNDDHFDWVATVQVSNVPEWEANANLIAEAGTVYHETGLTPRELVERYNEAISALKGIEVMLNNHLGDDDDETHLIESCFQVIYKSTE